MNSGENKRNSFKQTDGNPIILNFEKCRYLGEIHSELKTKFGLPEYYGENWDALWDCLRYLWSDGKNVKVYIHGFQTLGDELKAACKPMLELFDDVHKCTPNVTFNLIS